MEHHLTRPRCLAHVVNLAVVDFMSHITKIAVVESSNAIWEFDPSLPGNRVLSGSLDVILAIRTIAIKVSLASTPQLHPFYLFFRFSARASALNISSSCKFNVGLLHH
jgi:hypothetical protein